MQIEMKCQTKKNCVYGLWNEMKTGFRIEQTVFGVSGVFCWILCVKAFRSLFIQYIFILKVSKRLNEWPVSKSNDHDHKSLTFMYPLRCAGILFTLNLSIQSSDNRPLIFYTIFRIYIEHTKETKINHEIKPHRNEQESLSAFLFAYELRSKFGRHNDVRRSWQLKWVRLSFLWANIWIFEL